MYSRDQFPAIKNNYAAILAEYADAISCVSQALATIDQKISELENPQQPDRRGAPPPMDSSQARPYTAPPPDWSNSDADFLFKGLVQCGFTAEHARSVVLREGEDNAWQSLHLMLVNILQQQHNMTAEQAQAIIRIKGAKNVLLALESGDDSRRLLLS